MVVPVTINADTVHIGALIEATGNSNDLRINVPQKPIAGHGAHSPRNVVECACFNDAPLDLLSVDFTGREREMALIIEFLETAYDDLPTRCALHGMHGVGKSQVSYALAKELYNNGRYTNIFWMQATTIEKLHQGFSRLLKLVSHPACSSTDDETRLMAVRRWLEDFNSGRWLLVIDNVSRETVDFLREHLPRKNGCGNILFTTRTADVAKALTQAAGKRHGVVELRIPDVADAAKLFLKHLGVHETAADMSKMQEVVKGVGRLPLAIAQAASYMTETGSSLDDMLALFSSGRKIDVGVYSTSLVLVHSDFVSQSS
jgi:hypothetical protein